MHAEMMAYIMYVAMTLTVISYNSVFTQNTIDPEVSKTCATNNGLCGREIQQMYNVITHLKEKINKLELKDNERQREIKDLKNTNNSFEGNISSLQSENLVMEQRINELECLLKTNLGISNCADFYQLGHNEDGLYTISLCGKSYQLYCDMTHNGGGWTVIQRRFDGSVDFYRNWDSYKTGFGDLTREFWLGNDLTSLLTKHKQFDIHFSLEDFEGGIRYAEYSDFHLEDEEEKYILHVGSYSGDAGDALTHQNGMKFSSFDNDNDLDTANCATVYHGAFWFKDCYHAHLNGLYSNRSGSEVYGQGLVWLQWKGFYYSLKKTTMKIRPKDF